MKTRILHRYNGFTLLETVIAIGVLAVLLTGFMVVFAPAAAGIRKSINVQEADRLASTIEQELVTQRKGDGFDTGFDKAYSWIKKSNNSTDAILIYQYRAKLGGTASRSDGTMDPVSDIKNKAPGQDYVVVPMARLKSDSLLKEDLDAVEGNVYVVKCTQLIFSTGSTGGLVLGTAGQIVDPKGSGAASSDSTTYPEAVIAFSADFYSLPSKTASFVNSGGFKSSFDKARSPVFSRNLAVRR